jgi:hypothetical protein
VWAREPWDHGYHPGLVLTSVAVPLWQEDALERNQVDKPLILNEYSLVLFFIGSGTVSLPLGVGLYWWAQRRGGRTGLPVPWWGYFLCVSTLAAGYRWVVRASLSRFESAIHASDTLTLLQVLGLPFLFLVLPAIMAHVYVWVRRPEQPGAKS